MWSQIPLKVGHFLSEQLMVDCRPLSQKSSRIFVLLLHGIKLQEFLLLKQMSRKVYGDVLCTDYLQILECHGMQNSWISTWQHFSECPSECSKSGMRLKWLLDRKLCLLSTRGEDVPTEIWLTRKVPSVLYQVDRALIVNIEKIVKL